MFPYAVLLAGLTIRVRLMRSLPDRFKVDIFLKPGSHQSEHAGEARSIDGSNPIGTLIRHLPPVCGTVNKQLNDKERVAAALENPTLVDTVEQCLSNVDRDVTASD
jgi:hypothetical protein